ncbi:MAG: AMP-binding protein [Oscillospiraceae bacterium]|nr:AMP-binding protein [Oscillospiraceae bacterium]MBQ4642519.1 AMP-binding protein [Oscillospiraceae bacterium]
MEQTLSGMDYKIREIAGRIRELRQISGYSVEEMAQRTNVTPEEYRQYEDGSRNMSIAFLYRCVLIFGVDLSDLLEGHSPKLRTYALTRNGQGQRIEEAHHMVGYNLAADFRNRIALPLYMELAYREGAEQEDIELTTHVGQECDIVIRGHMRIQIGEHTEVLGPGDCIYYDSATPHGMVAVDGVDCAFYAIVLSNSAAREGEQAAAVETPSAKRKAADDERRIYHNFIIPTEDADGNLTAIAFQNEDKFNFAFDVIDALGRNKPERRAMLHVGADGTERTFTFQDMKKESARAANYFKAMGIKRGDRVMLVLKRHYQFWFAVLGLHKLGAVAIPATNQLLVKDFAYRFQAADVRAILCTADGDTADAVDEAAKQYPALAHKILVGGSRDGWHNFNEEYSMYSSHFARAEDAPCGNDPMLMFFTSGTSGYPKLAAHNYKYPLGHFITAKYWHGVRPDGLHLTISDTGWAKSMWGKLYGQWLCEAGLFVYDFDRFDAEKILPKFAQYGITTFCAPPTMYRMLAKQDLSRFDLSSIVHASTAGEALNPEVYRQFQNATGLDIMEGFGQSESTLIIGNLIGSSHKLGSMGKPVPLYSVQLLDAEGNPVDPGETGEICIDISKGLPCGLAYAYEGSPEVTAETWRDGYYHTGDLAWKDEDGFYWYVGRADDVIKSSGYRIGPFEIENVIMELPYVLECGVSAAPDEVRGQVVKASIVLVKDFKGTDELKKQIQDYVKSRTAPYKYPRIVEFRESLPKTTSGKIIRKQL